MAEVLFNPLTDCSGESSVCELAKFGSDGELRRSCDGACVLRIANITAKLVTREPEGVWVEDVTDDHDGWQDIE